MLATFWRIEHSWNLNTPVKWTVSMPLTLNGNGPLLQGQGAECDLRTGSCLQGNS